ncbi:MAG TPA: hypothetical protein VE010_09875 [Thermoanaerobaculia bacterium]|nr:hypothetical protein [Thermoanaerobaculia bacterium]
MTPPPDLVECVNCDGLFAAASLDDIFYHATAGCCREARSRSSRVVAQPVAPANHPA